MPEYQRMGEYQRMLEARFRKYPLSAPPAPWKETWRGRISGLLEIGFAPDSELLLVVSSEGRGVFDCRTGERVARDYEIDWDLWSDKIRLTAEGIGALRGQTLTMAGIWGGGLPLFTEDEWQLDVIPLNLIEYIVILCPPGSYHYNDKTFKQCFKVYDGDPVRACGFSYTGNSFAIAEGGGISLRLFSRG